jgi:hypothetical protein
MSIGVESSKHNTAKAVYASRVKAALEFSVKRQSIHLVGRNTNGGEPTFEDNTSEHFQKIGIAT